MSNEIVTDTAELIFDRRFRCRVPQLASTSEMYIKFFGTLTTGDNSIDKELANQLIDTYLPISDMVEYHRKGVAVYIPSREDIKTIYDYVDQHLHAWKQKMETSINFSNPPIDDLVALDTFANSVYRHARYEITQEETLSPFMRYLQSKSFGRDSLLRSKQAEEPVEENLPERNSFASLFKQQSKGLKPWQT